MSIKIRECLNKEYSLRIDNVLESMRNLEEYITHNSCSMEEVCLTIEELRYDLNILYTLSKEIDKENKKCL